MRKMTEYYLVVDGNWGEIEGGSGGGSEREGRGRAFMLDAETLGRWGSPEGAPVWSGR
jgi:hypothetical protein